MSGENGRLNGHASLNGADPVAAAKAIEDMTASGWGGMARRLIFDTMKAVEDVPDEVWRALVASCVRDLTSDRVGARRSSRDHLLRLRAMGVDAAVALDKIERLDSGDATENNDVRVLVHRVKRPEE